MTAIPTDRTKLLDELFTAERRVREIHARLSTGAEGDLTTELADAIEATRALPEESERTLRLVRIASLLGELHGDRTVDLLIDVLSSEEAEARRIAGEVLLEHAYDRFKEVALGVERALERLPAGDLALQELPFVLTEVGEPGVVKLLGRFLAHRDGEAVASAVEALAELGDPAAIPLLKTLLDDPREVVLEDEDGEEGTVAIGELVADALDLLEGEGEDEDAPPAPPARGPKKR